MPTDTSSELLKPRERQKRATQEKILDSALALFSERGFEGASIRDIASRAGVFHGLIKHHFNGKEQLWKAAVDRLFMRQKEEMAPPLGYDDLPPHERFRNWLHRYVRYCARHPEHARIMVQESMRDTERLRWAVEKHIAPAHDDAMDDIALYTHAGVFPALRARNIIYILFAAAQSPFMLSAEVALVENVDVTDEAEIEAYADDLFTFLVGPVAPQA